MFYHQADLIATQYTGRLIDWNLNEMVNILQTAFLIKIY